MKIGLWSGRSQMDLPDGSGSSNPVLYVSHKSLSFAICCFYSQTPYKAKGTSYQTKNLRTPKRRQLRLCFKNLRLDDPFYLQQLHWWPFIATLQIWDELSQQLALLEQFILSLSQVLQCLLFLFLQFLQFSLLLIVQDSSKLIKFCLYPLSLSLYLILQSWTSEKSNESAWQPTLQGIKSQERNIFSESSNQEGCRSRRVTFGKAGVFSPPSIFHSVQIKNASDCLT